MWVIETFFQHLMYEYSSHFRHQEKVKFFLAGLVSPTRTVAVVAFVLSTLPVRHWKVSTGGRAYMRYCIPRVRESK